MPIQYKGVVAQWIRQWTLTRFTWGDAGSIPAKSGKLFFFKNCFFFLAGPITLILGPRANNKYYWPSQIFFLNM